MPLNCSLRSQSESKSPTLENLCILRQCRADKWDADNFDPVKGSSPAKAGGEKQFLGEDEHLSKVKDSSDAGIHQQLSFTLERCSFSPANWSVVFPGAGCFGLNWLYPNRNPLCPNRLPLPLNAQIHNCLEIPIHFET